MLSGLTLSAQAATRADLATLVLWVLVHALVAGALVGLARLLQRWASCGPLVLGRIIVALILGGGQYLVLRTTLPALAGLLWIGVTTLAALVLIAMNIFGPLFGNLLWIPANALLPRHQIALRTGGRRALTMIGMAAVFSIVLGGSQQLVLQVYRPDAGAWPWTIFIGSAVGLVPLYRLVDEAEPAGRDSAAIDRSNRRLAFRILLMEAAMLIGAGVATGLLLLQWLG